MDGVLTNGGDVLAVHLLVAEIVVVVVDHHLAPDHLPAAAPPGPQAPPYAPPPTHPAPGLGLLAAPGGHWDRDTHAVRGEQVPGLGPHRDVLGVEVADAGQVHEGVIT